MARVKRKGVYEWDVQWHQNAGGLVIPKVAEKVLVDGARAHEQGAVDVEEEQHAPRPQRSKVASAGMRIAKAASSFAVFSMSSTWTTSTGECM